MTIATQECHAVAGLQFMDAANGDWSIPSSSAVRAGGFGGELEAAIMTIEWLDFHEQLCSRHENLHEIAKLATVEHRLQLNMTGDGLGHVELVGEIGDPPGIGNRLQIHFGIEQMQLKASIRELRGVLEVFPARHD